ncbi:MAG TPA: hypothetical protein VNZ49_09165 [Bacteroidia bacterium]|jgi:hypothetical protein|nr:hypothetical protein [Bacteroidia bacterium]
MIEQTQFPFNTKAAGKSYLIAALFTVLILIVILAFIQGLNKSEVENLERLDS